MMTLRADGTINDAQLETFEAETGRLMALVAIIKEMPEHSALRNQAVKHASCILDKWATPPGE
jgi:hypothetical protein